MRNERLPTRIGIHLKQPVKNAIIKRIDEDSEFCLAFLDMLLKYTTTMAGTEASPEAQQSGGQQQITVISNVPRPEIEPAPPARKIEAGVVDVPLLEPPADPSVGDEPAEPIEVVLEDEEEIGDG